MGNNHANPQTSSMVESPTKSTVPRTQPKPRAMSLSCQRELHRRRQEIERKNSVKERSVGGSKMNQLFHSDDEYYQKILNCLELPTVRNRRDDSRHILAPRVKGDSNWEKMRLWMMWSIRNSMEKEDENEAELPVHTPRRVTISQSLETCTFSVP